MAENVDFPAGTTGRHKGDALVHVDSLRIDGPPPKVIRVEQGLIQTEHRFVAELARWHVRFPDGRMGYVPYEEVTDIQQPQE